eukprot:4347226-Amphidinium_carterae.1
MMLSLLAVACIPSCTRHVRCWSSFPHARPPILLRPREWVDNSHMWGVCCCICSPLAQQAKLTPNVSGRLRGWVFPKFAGYAFPCADSWARWPKKIPPRPQSTLNTKDKDLKELRALCLDLHEALCRKPLYVVGKSSLLVDDFG